MDLTKQKCVPCEGGTPPLEKSAIRELIQQVSTEWKIIEDKKISRLFSFKNFKLAMQFVNAVAAIAENEGHHPDIAIHYNKVTLVLWTHAIGGLSQNDFIVASKIDSLKI